MLFSILALLRRQVVIVGMGRLNITRVNQFLGLEQVADDSFQDTPVGVRPIWVYKSTLPYPSKRGFEADPARLASHQADRIIVLVDYPDKMSNLPSR